MFGIRVFVIGLLVGLCSGIFVTHFHVIRTNDGFDVVARVNQPPLRSSYCDVRQWSSAMWANHPEVTAALVKGGRSNVIGQNLKDNLLDEVLPKPASGKNTPVIDSSVASGSVPVITQSSETTLRVADQAGSTSTVGNQWLDQKTQLRQDWESILDKAIAPIVEPDSTATTAASPIDSEVLPSATSDALVQKLEEQFGGSQRLNQVPAEAKQAVEGAARDFLQQVIPGGRQAPHSAAPLRNLSRELLSAPAPVQR